MNFVSVKMLKRSVSVLILLTIFSCVQSTVKEWVPNTDWGHWILGHRSDPAFLEKNHMTVTFGSGAPNFDNVSTRSI